MQAQYLRKLIHNDAFRFSGAWAWCLPIWLISRLYFSVLGFILWALQIIPLEPAHSFYYDIQPVQSGWSAAWLWVWLRWDGVEYLRIALNGYLSSDLSAWFPLYPLLARWLSPLFGGNTLAALLIVSSLAYLGVLVLLYQLITEQFNQSIARRAVVVTAFFPSSLFFIIPYPHSLMLLLTLGTYACARHSRWFGATILGLLGGLAHSTVIPLVILLALMIWKEFRVKQTINKYILWLVPFAPLLGYACFMAWRYQQGFPSQASLTYQLWGVYVTPPWTALLEIPLMVKSVYFPTIGWVDILLFIVVVGFTIYYFRKIPMELWFYQVSLLIFLMTITTKGGPLHGFTRYMVIMFPLYLEIALWASTKWRRMLGTIIGLLLQTYLAGLYLLWAWVG